MRVGLVVPVYNRPEYLAPSLASLTTTRTPPDVTYLVNDAGTDPEANRLFSAFDPPWPGLVKVVNASNRNVNGCLLDGWRHLLADGADVLVNLDSDTLVRPHWLDALLALHRRFPDAVVTGFNTATHPVRGAEPDHCLKETVGGINTLFGKHLFPVVEPCLAAWDWDWRLCDAMRRLGRPFVVSRPSVVQHLGVHGITSSPDRGVPVAVDFDGCNRGPPRRSAIRRPR